MKSLCESPKSFYENLPVKSAIDHFLSDNLNLNQLIAQINENEKGGKYPEIGIFKVKALLNIMIGDLVLSLNVGKSMTESQIVMTAKLIFEEYPYFKPEDFKLCFERAKKGVYGSLYDRLDGQVIFGWLRSFDDERTAEIEDMRQTQNTQRKKAEAKPLLTTEFKANADKNESFKKHIAILLEAHENRKKVKLQAETERKQSNNSKGPVYEMHQRWLKQFDALWKRQKYPPNRQVKKYGKITNPFWMEGSAIRKYIMRQLDINAYLEYKQWQYVTFNLPTDQRKKEYVAKYPKI